MWRAESQECDAEGEEYTQEQELNAGAKSGDGVRARPDGIIERIATEVHFDAVVVAIAIGIGKRGVGSCDGFLGSSQTVAIGVYF